MPPPPARLAADNPDSASTRGCDVSDRSYGGGSGGGIGIGGSGGPADSCSPRSDDEERRRLLSPGTASAASRSVDSCGHPTVAPPAPSSAKPPLSCGRSAALSERRNYSAGPEAPGGMGQRGSGGGVVGIAGWVVAAAAALVAFAAYAVLSDGGGAGGGGRAWKEQISSKIAGEISSE
eukprot:366467-Chlamydomonas_euryale.AAC.1